MMYSQVVVSLVALLILYVFYYYKLQATFIETIVPRLQDIQNIFENTENTRFYTSIYKRLNEYMTPYDIINCANCFTDREESTVCSVKCHIHFTDHC